ncbi:MAG: Peptidoglycan D,D-transpeptidase FtsI [Chlamydiales bacterium]|nr:Peptidoglycan D,D-transpeptidase FtsI [Chlamydiales bacterium]
MKQKKRLVIISIGIFFLFSLLIVHYFKIQILEGEKWTRRALAQHEFVIQEPFKRGTFYANPSLKQGHPEAPQPLVFDVTKFHLYADPLSIPKEYRDEVVEGLNTIIAVDQKELNRTIRNRDFALWIDQEAKDGVQGFGKIVTVDREDLNRKTRSRRLALWLGRETKEAILEWWRPFAKQRKIARNALYFVTDYRRSYPYGKMLGQVLHTIREMKDETTYEGLPTGGLEAYFNAYLKGKIGKRKRLRSPLNQLEIDQVIEEPEDGADVYLTIDPCMQAIVEEELEKGVAAAQAKGGWAVMLNPHNGEVLALAQYPYFDPSRYQDFFNDPEKMEDAKVKAVSDAFELGSIMKPITIALAMKANKELESEGKKPIYDPHEKLAVTRSSFPGRASRPLYDLPRHKALNMYMALQKSSNVYMAEVIDRVIEARGSQWYRKELVDVFGFETKSGIELPGEAYGLVPTPGKMHPSGALEWSVPTPYSLSIGYNMLATSLQMLRAFAVFANGGFLVDPTLVRKIVGKEGVLLDHTLFSKKRRVLDEEIAQEVVKGMKFSTKPGGTGRLASVSGYSEAGKTGTAEKIVGGVYSKQRYISSFIGMAPANRPRLVLIVTLDEPKPIRLEGGIKNYVGGRCSAPVFAEMAKRTLEYLGEPPDDPYGYPPGDPRYDPEKADWMKEVRELKLLYEQWNRP